MSAEGMRQQLAELGDGLERLDAVLHAIDREIGTATPENVYASRHVVETLLRGVDELIADLRTLPALLGEHADDLAAVTEGASHVHGEDYLPLGGESDRLMARWRKLFERIFPAAVADQFDTVVYTAAYRDWPALEKALDTLETSKART